MNATRDVASPPRRSTGELRRCHRHAETWRARSSTTTAVLLAGVVAISTALPGRPHTRGSVGQPPHAALGPRSQRIEGRAGRAGRQLAGLAWKLTTTPCDVDSTRVVTTRL